MKSFSLVLVLFWVSSISKAAKGCISCLGPNTQCLTSPQHRLFGFQLLLWSTAHLLSITEDCLQTFDHRKLTLENVLSHLTPARPDINTSITRHYTWWLSFSGCLPDFFFIQTTLAWWIKVHIFISLHAPNSISWSNNMTRLNKAIKANGW